MPWHGTQVYNIKQAKRDIDAVYSMGLFDDVNILPAPAADTTLENPKVSRPAPVGLPITFCSGLSLRAQLHLTA